MLAIEWKEPNGNFQCRLRQPKDFCLERRKKELYFTHTQNVLLIINGMLLSSCVFVKCFGHFYNMGYLQSSCCLYAYITVYITRTLRMDV